MTETAIEPGTIKQDAPIVAKSLIDNPDAAKTISDVTTPGEVPPIVATSVIGDAPIQLTETVSPPAPEKEEEFEPLEEGETEITEPETPVNEVAPVCNCGKKDGQAGPHRKSCPVRGSGKTPAKPAATAATATTSSVVATPGVTQSQQSLLPDNILAASLFKSATSSLSLIFGDEWKPENAEEEKTVVDALTIYFKSKDIKDIPPGVLCLFVVGAYAAKRCAHPNTKAKLIAFYIATVRPFFKRFWGWLKGLFNRTAKESVKS